MLVAARAQVSEPALILHQRVVHARKWKAQKSLCVSELRPNHPPYTYMLSPCTTAEWAERALGTWPATLTRSAAFSPSGAP